MGPVCLALCSYSISSRRQHLCLASALGKKCGCEVRFASVSPGSVEHTVAMSLCLHHHPLHYMYSCWLDCIYHACFHNTLEYPGRVISLCFVEVAKCEMACRHQPNK